MPQIKSILNLIGDRLYSLPIIVLYITDGCNSRCRTCDIWKNARRNMPMPLVESIASTCAELGVQWIVLSGGEAMQHPEWDTIARRFKQEGVKVSLLTNGVYLQKDAHKLVDVVDEVIVSLDGGTAETYAEIRGIDAFDLLLEGIDAVHALGIPVRIRSTIQRLNFREMPAIIATALAHQVDTVSFLAMDVSNPFAFGERTLEDDSDHLSSADLIELEQIITQLEQDFAPEFRSGRIAESPAKLRITLLQYFRAILGEGEFPKPRCNAPHLSTVIEVDGRLRPCYFLPSYGRLQPDGDRLPVALNMDTAQALRKAYRSGARTECERCVCPLYKGVRSLMRI